MGSSPPLELSVEEFLARLTQDRRVTLATLYQRPWRLTSIAIPPRDFWDLFRETVRDDGSVDVAGLTGVQRADAARAVVAIGLAAYASGGEITGGHDDDHHDRDRDRRRKH